MTRSFRAALAPPRATLRAWLGCSLLLWGARLAVAWAASRPLALVVGAGDHEDRLLFESGSLLLLEVLRLRADLLGDALRSTLLLLMGSWIVLLVVTNQVLVLLGRVRASSQEAPLRPELANPWASLPRIGALSLLAGGACVVVGILAALLVGAVHGGLQGASAPVREIAVAGVLATCLLPFGAMGALFDLARVHVLTGGHGVAAAVRRAWSTFTRHLRRLVMLRLAIAAASLLLVVGVGALVAAQPLSTAANGPVLVVLVAHRAAGFLLAALQVTWFTFLVKSALTPQA